MFGAELVLGTGGSKYAFDQPDIDVLCMFSEIGAELASKAANRKHMPNESPTAARLFNLRALNDHVFDRGLFQLGGHMPVLAVKDASILDVDSAGRFRRFQQKKIVK